MDPTCATGCDEELAVLPGFLFDDCAPETNGGEVSEIFLGIPGNPFTAITSLAEWTARLAATGATRLIRLTVIGDRPRSTGTEPIRLAGGIKKSVPRNFALNFTIDQTSQANHEGIRQLQCGGNFPLWYRTFENKYVFGGNQGIKVFIDPDMVIPRENTANMVYEATATWTSAFMEERTVFPLA